MNREVRLAVLTRDPVPGYVKTRLIPALGAEGAAMLHRSMASETIVRALASGLPVTVHLQGDLRGDFAAELRAYGASVVAQASGDLGARIGAALAGAGRRLVIGTDSPTLATAWLLRAAEAPGPVVLGPAEDGGYWLLGVDGPAEPLLEGVPWSTAGVLAATLARAALAGLGVTLLPRGFDVDVPADLDRLVQDPDCPPALSALIGALRAAPVRSTTG